MLEILYNNDGFDKGVVTPYDCAMELMHEMERKGSRVYNAKHLLF